MVVLSAAITTKTGKVLMARQFVTMTRMRIESLLAGFPKLVGPDSQHTFAETSEVRYVYQRLDKLFLLLITTKQSNILEDLDTLRLLAKIVPEYAGATTEQAVQSHVFDLVSAFDEVISIGHRETVTLQQVRTFTEMDSHEEKLQKIIMESKQNEARDEARRRAEALDKQKSQMRKMQSLAGGGGGYPGSSRGGVGGGYGGGGNNAYGSSQGGYGDNHSPHGGYGGNSGSGYGGDSRGNDRQSSSRGSNPKPPSKPRTKVKGMALGKPKQKTDDFFSKMAKEEKLTVFQGPPGTAAAAQVEVAHEHVHVVVEEKCVLLMERDGGVKKLEVKGEMKLSVFDPDESRIHVHAVGTMLKDKSFKCRLHPKINKQMFAKEGVLGLSDPTKPFPVGSSSAPVILKWRMQTNEESEVPFTLNFWPNEEDGQSVVSVEYAREKEINLSNITVSIPCRSSEPPTVTAVDGDHAYDAREGVLVWSIPAVDEDNESGSFEFSVPQVDSDDFFPIYISFDSVDTYGDVRVEQVVQAEGGEQVEFTQDTRLNAERWVIE